MIRQFEVGRRYSCRLVTNYDTVLVYEVVARTAKFITVERCGEDDLGKRLGVRVYNDVELCNPWGHYSMAPILRADHEVTL